MKEIYHDYFSYLMDEKVTARKMSREFWNELDDTRPFGASLQQEVPNWPWATKIVVLVLEFTNNSYLNSYSNSIPLTRIILCITTR